MSVKYVVCDPACTKPCKQAISVITEVRKCVYEECNDPSQCCSDGRIPCVEPTVEQIASAKLRGLI